MSKKSVNNSSSIQEMEIFDEYEFGDEMMNEVMDGFMFHETEILKAAQTTAIELTKLALTHAKNVDENKVFELFRRSAQEISNIYRNDD